MGDTKLRGQARRILDVGVGIGGGSLNGGQGTVIGTIVGSFIMGLLSNGCNLLGISPFVQQVVIGSVIVLAVTLDEYQRRRMS